MIGNFRRAWKINENCNEWSHYNPSKEKRSIEGVLVLISEFAKEECGIELEVPSSEESSIFRELAAMKAEIEEGGFSDSPDICPHCNNFIGYIEFKVELDHPRIRGSMEWRKEHDRNYCPFCLKKEYIPTASKEIQFPFNYSKKKNFNVFLSKIYSFTQKKGGKVYLVQDNFLSNKIFKKMYPEYKKFKKEKNKVDKYNLLENYLYKRLIK